MTGRRKLGSDIIGLSKVCTVANEGPWAMYEKKPQWKYERLRHESYRWKLDQKYMAICGSQLDIRAYCEYISETVYVATAYVRKSSKKEELLREEGFM